MNEGPKQTAPLPLYQAPLQQNQRMASDSSGDDDEEDEDDDDGFSRNVPRGDYQTVSAQITTIKYAGGENRTSPRNILAPDLGNSIGTSQLKKNA